MKRNTIIDAFIGLFMATALLWFIIKIINIKTPIPPSHIDPIILTNTETIYQEIEVLKIKQDTIKLYYEKKINIYRALPTPDRVKLFAKRINQ
jgi:hypothetical protein